MLLYMLRQAKTIPCEFIFYVRFDKSNNQEHNGVFNSGTLELRNDLLNIVCVRFMDFIKELERVFMPSLVMKQCYTVVEK